MLITTLLAMLLTPAIGGVAQAAELSGFVEARGQLSAGLDGTPWQTTQRLRPSFDAEPHARVRVHATVEASLTQGRYELAEGYALASRQLGSVLATADCGLEAPPRVSEADDVLGVERLFVDLYLPKVDLRIGRQALTWGSALYFNPTDLFAQVLVSQPWAQRAGVDAVRATIPIGDGHRIVGVGAITPDLQQGRFGVRATAKLGAAELSGLGAVTTDADGFYGLDVRVPWRVGGWLEARSATSSFSPVLSVGVDHAPQVLDRLYLAAQYTYDSTGLPDPALYSLAARGVAVPLPDCLSSMMDAEGVSHAPRLNIGRHYSLLYVQAAYAAFSGSFAALTNLQDRSTALVPSLAWQPGGVWALTVGAQASLGEGELSPGAAMTQLDLGPSSLDVDGLLPSFTAFSYLRVSL